ncbi:MAG: hypothetical protein WA138_16090 [Parvibaculum sp.]
MNANVRGYQTLPQVKSVVSDSLNPVRTSIATKLNTTQLTDTLNANVRGYQTLPQVKSVVSDSVSKKLNADFVNSYVYDGSPSTTDYVAVQKEGAESIRYNTLGEMPTSQPTNQLILDKVTELTELVNQSNVQQSITNDSLFTLITKLTLTVDSLKQSQVITNPFPSAPTNLVATGGAYKIDLSWTPSTSSHDSTEIRSRLAGTSNFTFLASVDSGITAYSHTGLGSNISRDYIVYAKKGTQYSNASNIANGTTDDATVLPVETGYIHIADAEENDLSEWSYSDIRTGATLTAKDTAKLHGSYGFLATLDGTAMYDYVRYDLPTALDSVRVRLYITFKDSIFLENRYGFPLIKLGYNGTTMNNPIISLTSVTDSSYASDLKRVSTSVKPIGWVTTDTICVEMFYKKGTGTNGIIKIYINGVLKSDVNNSSEVSQVNQILIGVISVGDRIGSSGAWFKFDDVVINDTSYIGLYNATGAGSGGTPVATQWFVDKNATGTGTGRTIENAWTSFANIGWSSMADNDTLFISGGADSTIYYEQLNVQKNNITIMPSALTGHNGKVIIDGNNGSISYGIYVSGRSGIKLRGLYVRECSGSNINLNSSNCTIAYNDLTIGSGATMGLWIRGSNNIIEHNTSRTTSIAGDGQRDWIQMSTGGHHIIRYNTFYNYNTGSGDHTDFIQCYAPFDDVEIYGNYAVDVEEKRYNSNLLYLNGIGGVVKVYDNVVIDQSDSTTNSLMTIKETSTATDLDTLLVYNNSLYCSGFGVAINIDASVAGTSVYMAIYNNAIRGDSKGRAIYTTNAFVPLKVFSTTTPVIDNNIYWEDDPSRTLSLNYNGTGYSLANWQGLGFDANGLNEAPSYTSITEGAFNLQSTTGGNLINTGHTIPSNFGIKYNYDILGVSRPVGAAYDIGAYEKP